MKTKTVKTCRKVGAISFILSILLLGVWTGFGLACTITNDSLVTAGLLSYDDDNNVTNNIENVQNVTTQQQETNPVEKSDVIITKPKLTASDMLIQEVMA